VLPTPRDPKEIVMTNKTLQMLAVAMVVAASASSAFAANKYDRDYGQSPQVEHSDTSNVSASRESMVHAN
jgi:hypothetical protein